jgi:hypothetical protein
MTAADLVLNYFLIYDAANKVAAGTVWLKGAFDDQRQRFQLALLDYVAMPAAKDKDKDLPRIRMGISRGTAGYSRRSRGAP